MRTEEIIKKIVPDEDDKITGILPNESSGQSCIVEDDGDDFKVIGKMANSNITSWGNIVGNLSDQEDLSKELSLLDKKINALAPEGMIADVLFNGVSVVSNNVANVNVPVDKLEYEIKNAADSANRALKGVDKVANDLSQVDKTIHEQVDPELERLSEDIALKVSAAWYDEEAHFTPEGETTKYWYLMSSPDFDPESYEDIEKYIIKNSEGEMMRYDFGKGGGGGGGGGDDTIVKVKPLNWPTAISLGTKCIIKINWTSYKDTGEGQLEPTGPGKIQVTVDGVVAYLLQSAAQGDLEFDLTDFIKEGANKVSVVATDSYDNTGRTVSTISTVDLRLTSTFDDSRIYSDIVNYTYIPIGDIKKTVHFIVDGTETGTDVVMSSNEQQTHRFLNWQHGHHTLLVYFTCLIDGNTVKSNELYYDLVYDGGLRTPIIASTFTSDKEEQYSTFSIPYRVYTPYKNDSSVSFYVDGVLDKTLTVDQSTHYWECRNDTVGQHAYKIQSGTTSRIFNIEVIESEIDVKPVTENLALELTAIGRSNAEDHPEVWKDAAHNISATLSNFNFSSDGWIQKSEEGVVNTVLRVTGDARVTIPYKIFEKDFKATGKTIEIELATSDVMNYESTILSCFADSRGIVITPQLAKIRSLQSELQTQYKEDDHVRISFVIDKSNENRLVLMYVNGIMCGAVQYPTTDNFRQLSPVGISIGSNDATIDIYTIRIYDNNLTRKQVVNNWIADTQSGILKKERFARNDNYNESGEIVTSKLPTNIPYMIWDIDPLPQYKGDKRPGNVEYVDQINTSRSFTSTADTYNVQGTSSAVYPVKNIRIKYKKSSEPAWISKEFTWKDKDGNDITKFAVTEGGIGDNYFTYKVDYASSEGANNVELTKFYNDVSKANGILTPAQQQDGKVRVGIDGFPIIAFKKDASGKVSFVTKANFNNDKANEKVYGFAEGDESWETTNNSAEEALYKKPVTDSTFSNAFEIRYPDEDGYSDLTRLKPMTEWVCSTNKSEATGEEFEEPVTFTYTNVTRAEDGSYSTVTVEKTFESDTAEYRLSKFKAELADHFNVKSTLFYYLFTHLFLMVDSRAKNAFPTYLKSRATGDGGDRWFWLPYDMDTALGINNEGKLVFDYNLEDIDKVDGSNVFNGQDSVMWCNVREMFDGEIGQLYSQLRTNLDVEFSYDALESRFDAHQSKWPETVFNEDAYKKYIVPLASGDNYLEMLQGSKAEQRKWWLYNRFKYFDSKYLAGDAKADFIQFRAYAKSNLTITPYADIYATASFANGMVVAKRAHRGEAIVLENPLPESASDQETYIYSASQLKSIGDISGFQPDTLKVANAVRLQSLKVGDSSSTYTNPHLTELTLGSNKLLKTLDVRNCTNLTQTVDVSGCTNIEEIYFDGTKITGIILPSGGILKKLHLPNTITELSIIDQKSLSDLQIAGTENIQKLRLENIPAGIVDIEEMIDDMVDGSAVRVVGFKKTVSTLEEIASLYDKFDKKTGIDARGEDTPKAQISGLITISNPAISEITYAQFKALNDRYPDIEIDGVKIICVVSFYNDDEFYFEENVNRGSDAPLPDDPTKEPDQQYTYVFNSWDQDLTNIRGSLRTDAVYDKIVNNYTVTFDTQTTKASVPSQTVAYGSTAIKPIDPVITGASFLGWYKEPECINAFSFSTAILGDTTLYGKWDDHESPMLISIERDTYNKFTFRIDDNIAVVKYAVTKSNDVPETWTSVTPTTSLTMQYEVTASGSYYVWGSDNAGNVVNSRIMSYSITETKSPGAILDVMEGTSKTSGFALQGTTLTVSGSLDSHYKDMILKLNGEVVDNNTTFEISANATVQEICTPKTYEVSFNLMGHGSSEEKQYIVYNNLVVKPQNRYDNGYIMSGWFTEYELENEWDFATDKVTQDMTLYVKWVEYREPTVLTVESTADNADFTVSFYQNESNGVAVRWDTAGEVEKVSQVGNVSISHTYTTPGEHKIYIRCEHGVYQLGSGSITKPTVEPITALKDIDFAYDVAYTQMYAFKGATSLTQLKLTNYMTRVEIGTFDGCTGITSINFPSNISVIAAHAFRNCSGLTGTVTIPTGVSRIEDYAFTHCTSVENFSLPNTIVSLGQGTFEGCTSYKNIEIPANLTYLPDSLYRNTGVESIDIPARILHLGTLDSSGGCVFAECLSLSKVILRGTGLTIGPSTFSGCTLLNSAGPIGSGKDIEFAWDTEIPAYAFNQAAIDSVVLPATITKIGASAFEMCQDLEEINLPVGLKEIGDGALSHCFRLSIELPETLEVIGNNCFYQSWGLTGTLDIPSSVVTIGSGAFKECYPLNRINLYTTSSTFKADTAETSWFRGCNSSLKLHISSSIPTAEAAQLSYGLCWNYYGNDLTLTVIPDLE